MPCGSPSASRARITSATSSAESTRHGDRQPGVADVEPGQRVGAGSPAPAPTASPAARGWPATSRIDFTPAHTTVTGAVASAARSADSSQVLPGAAVHPAEAPVANTRMPASRARYAVAATVVAPVGPRRSTTAEVPDAGLHHASPSATRTSASSASPTRTAPSTRPPSPAPPRRAYRRLDLPRGPRAGRGRQPVADDRGLQRDDPRPSMQ